MYGNQHIHTIAPLGILSPSLMETATEYPVVLLCECADYHTCHRNVVADELVKRYGLHVTHLSSSQLLQKPLTVEVPLRQC